MRLNRYILDLYFDSVDGRDLVDGFTILRVGWSGWHGFVEPEADLQTGTPVGAADGSAEGDDPDAPEDNSANPDDVPDPGDEGEPGDDAEEEATNAALIESALSVLAAGDGVDAASMTVLRTLAEQAVQRPTSFEEARALYERLLAEGVTLGIPDVEAVNALIEALESDDVAEASKPEGGSEGEEGDAELEETTEPSESQDEQEDDSVPSRTPPMDGGESAPDWVHHIAGISWGLHCFAPEFFVPYLFRTKFHQFEAICAELEIPMPRLPGKASAPERAMYYFELNAVLQDFRTEHRMTPDELNAFLYGFATRAVPIEEVDPLPEPARAWLLLGSPDDAPWLDAAGDDSHSHWQGGYDIRPGDICVMWCRSPRSYVHSVWRATSSGFADPFFYYYRTVWIARPLKVPPITFAEIQADPVWSQKPAVRAHFQNSSGKEITRQEYDALLRMFESKGFDTGPLPKLQEVSLGLDPTELERESDVEEKLLEPLLEKLGLKKRDWRRQVPLRMGRGIRVYPDYVLGLRGDRGDESARAIIEAKLRISGPRDLDEAFSQAASYAARLRAEALCLCAAEGLWLYRRENGRFRRSTVQEVRWSDVGEPVVLRKLGELLCEKR